MIWTMNCVGIKNHKFFVLTIFYAFLYSFLIYALCITNFAFWLIGVFGNVYQQVS